LQAFVIELALMLKDQTIVNGLPTVVLAFITSWATWFNVNMLMNRANVVGVYLWIVYVIAISMTVIAALSAINKEVGPVIRASFPHHLHALGCGTAQNEGEVKLVTYTYIHPVGLHSCLKLSSVREK
jgi:hypothetical protein